MEEADAVVPAEEGVVVGGGTDFFRFGVAGEGAFEEREQRVGRLADAELGFGAAFIEQAAIIVALVGVGEALKNIFGFVMAVGGNAEKLVGDGEAEEAQGELMIRLDGENVAADGFGFLRLVERAIESDAGGGLRDGGAGDGFEVVVHCGTLFSTIRGKWKVGYIEELEEKRDWPQRHGGTEKGEEEERQK